jgi:hypothetical protein
MNEPTNQTPLHGDICRANPLMNGGEMAVACTSSIFICNLHELFPQQQPDKETDSYTKQHIFGSDLRFQQQ